MVRDSIVGLWGGDGERESGTLNLLSVGERKEAMQGVRHGGCNCGAVRLEVRGEPMRAGLCHCLTCRKETGAPFMAFAVWDQSQVSVAGDTRSWTQTTDHRHFCPSCGSSLFGAHDADSEVEVRLGCFDEAPTDLNPEYELWISRREHWLSLVADAAQHTRSSLFGHINAQ